MAMAGKTIQFYLPDGEPRGIRIAEITTRIVQAVAVPRALLDKAKKRTELSNVGIYLLLGSEEEGARPKVYVGQSETPHRRLLQHTADEKKDFWDTAVVFISRTDSFTLTDVRYLEYHCQMMTKQADQYALQNTVESEPHVPEPQMADLLDTFDTMAILVSALGYPVFDSLEKASVAGPVNDPASELFYCTGPEGGSGVGKYVDDGFVVLKESVARNKISQSGRKLIEPVRERLLTEGILTDVDGKLVFQQDYKFRRPSAASCQILGYMSNGWVRWKSKDGKSLDELMRQDNNIDESQ